MTVSHDSIFLFDSRDNLLRLDLATGKPLWSRSSAGVEPLSRPAVIGELVYGLFADGTLRAFSKTDGSPINTAMNVPVWYWTRSDKKEFRDLVGGLGVSDDTLIVTTGCRSVYAIQRAQ
jgi:outer membrane protein assembly factor BamB